MNVQFHLEPNSRAIGNGGGGYRSKIDNRLSRSFDEVVEGVAKNTGQHPELVKMIAICFLEEVIRDACTTGNVQKLDDYGSFELNLHGRFEGVNDVYDPKRHTLDMTFKGGRKFKDIEPKFTLVNRVKPETIIIYGAIGKYIQGVSQGYWYMTWGYDTMCNGENVRMYEGDSVTWSVKIGKQEYSGPCEVYKNSSGTLDFRWPEGIPREAIGRELTLTFRLRGSRPENAPVEIRHHVKLFDA